MVNPVQTAMATTMTEDQKLQMRASLEMAGALNTKQGLIMLYTCVMGMSIIDAMPHIKAECELRGIDLHADQKPKPSGVDSMLANMEKIGGFLQKNPQITDMVKPFVIGAVTALTSAVVGKKIASSDDADEEDYSEVVVEDLDDPIVQEVEIVDEMSDNQEVKSEQSSSKPKLRKQNGESS